MNAYVVDASVAVKWVLPTADEQLVPEAVDLLENHTLGRTQLLVPDLFWVECANGLWKSLRKGRVSEADAQSGLAALKAYNIITVASPNLIEMAFANAASLGCSVYDSLYVALAVEFEIPLVTADEKLVSSLAGRVPVKWLGAI